MQIFLLPTTYQNEEKITTHPKVHIPIDHTVYQFHKIYQLTTKYTNWSQSVPIPQNIPIDHKVYQLTTKYTKLTTKYTNWPQSIPIDHKVYQIDHKVYQIDHIVYQHFQFKWPTKLYPNCNFWNGNLPSGNPGLARY
jgi:hypothetical protein